MQFKQGVEGIKERVKKVSEEFGIECEDSQLDYYLITLEEALIESFIAGSPNPDLNLEREKPEERAKKLGQYIESKEFNHYLDSLNSAGTMIRKSRLLKEKEALRFIEGDELREKVDAFYQRCLEQYTTHRLALVSFDDGCDKIGLYVLAHEWVHRVLFDSKINFDTKNPDYYYYDEGLAEYLTYCALDKEEDIEKVLTVDKKDELYKENALFFKKLLKNKTPEERRESIFNLLESIPEKKIQSLP
jgi:hypothetical protein